MQRPVAIAAPLAALLWAASAAAFGARFDVFSHVRHPLGLLGATLVPGATAFNLLAFVVPGLLAVVPAVALRGRLADAGWAARIGAQALLLSGIAFAAQGLFPLDSRDLDGDGSRLHAAAWTVWWLAFGVGAALLLTGLRGDRHRSVAAAIAACAAGTLAFALLAPVALPGGVVQRVAYAFWFAALWFAGRRQP